MPRNVSPKDKNQYIQNINNFIASNNDRYAEFKKTFGPQGKLSQGYVQNDQNNKQYVDEFNSVTINMPEGISEEQVLAITIGAHMVTSDWDHKIDDSERDDPDLPFLDSHRLALVENLNSDTDRDNYILPIVVNGRKKAKTAIERLPGSWYPSKSNVKNLVDFALRDISSYTGFNSITESKYVHDTRRMAYLLAAKMLDDPQLAPDFEVNYRYEHELDYLKLRSFAKEVEAAEKAAEIKKALLSEEAPANSKRRKELAEDLIFNSLIAKLSNADASKLNWDGIELIKDLYLKMGLDYEKREDAGSALYSILFDDENKTIENLKVETDNERKVKSSFSQHTISDLKVLLSRPDGAERLKKLYSKAIRKTDIYTNLVTADQDQLVGAMMDIDDFAKDQGIYAIPGVKIPEAAKSYNEKHKKDMMAEIKASMNVVEKSFYNQLQERDEAMTFKGLSQEDLRRNVIILNNIYTTLRSSIMKTVKREKIDEGITDILESLDIFRAHASDFSNSGTQKSYEDFNTYKKLANNVLDKIDKYFETAGPAKAGTAEAKQIAAIGRAKRSLKANLISLDERYNELFAENEARSNPEQEMADIRTYINAAGKNVNKYDPRAAGNNNPFRKGEYKDKDINVGNGYSTDRSAVYSIAMMSLVAKNKEKKTFTFDDLADLSKLEKEKSAALDEVVTRIARKSPEDQQWIAQNIYDGLFEMEKLVREKMAGLDFSDPNTLLSDDYIKVIQMSYYAFDAWQEMRHCEKELVAIANSHDPNIKNYVEAKEALGQLNSIYNLQSKMTKEKIDGITKYTKGKFGSSQNIINDAIGERVVAQVISEGAKKGIAANKLLSFMQHHFLETYVITAQTKMYMDIKYPNAKADIMREVTKMVCDGTFLKDISIKIDLDNPVQNQKVIVKGIPTADDIQGILDLKAMPLVVRQNSNRQNIDNMEEFKESRKEGNKAFIDKAVRGYSELNEMIAANVPLVGENKDKAFSCMRDILKGHMVGMFEVTGLVGESLDKALDKTIDDMKLLPSKEDFFGMGILAKYAYTSYSKNLINSKQAELEKIVTDNLFMKNYEEMDKADQERDRMLQESMLRDNITSLRNIGTSMEGIGGISINDKFYNDIIDQGEGTYEYTAFSGDKYNGRNEIHYYSENSHTVQPVSNKKKYAEYVEKTNKYIADLERIIENEVREGRASDKSAEFLHAFGINSVKRALKGYTGQFMLSRTPIVQALNAPNAFLDTKGAGLKDKIDKYNSKFPVYDLVIEGSKLTDTLVDYWDEKTNGIILESREEMYRNQLYTQVNNMIAFADKMEAAVIDPNINAELKGVGVFSGMNDPFEAHRISPRGIGMLTASLEAYKKGLENGWAIDDLGMLAAFNHFVSELNLGSNYKRTLKLDENQKYEEMQGSPEKKAFIKKLNEFNDKMLGKKLTNAEERKAYIAKMKAFVAEAKEKKYGDEKITEAGDQMFSFADRNTRKIELGLTKANHSQVNPDLNAKNADFAYENDKLTRILNKFNAKRTDGYLSEESDQHKELRMATVSLQEELSGKHALENANGPGLTIDQKMKIAAAFIGKLDEVIYLSKEYQKSRASSSSTGGKERLEGSKQIEEYAKHQRNKILNDLKAEGLTVNKATINNLREAFAFDQKMEAVNKLMNAKEMPKNVVEEGEFIHAAADILVFKFASSQSEANRNAFTTMGSTRLKRQILNDKEFNKLMERYFKDPQMTPESFAEELEGNKALEKMRGLNRKYAEQLKDQQKDFNKKQQEMTKRSPRR